MAKSEKMEVVAEQVLKIVALHGLNGLSYSGVARAAKVSRAWIYKYIGSERSDLIKFAVSHFGRVYTSLDLPTPKTDRAGFIKHAQEGLSMAMHMPKKWPWLLPIYYRYAGTKTPIGEVIADIEKQYFAKVSKEFKEYLGLKKTDPLFAAEVMGLFNLGVAFSFHKRAESDPRYVEMSMQVVKKFLESLD